MLLIFLGVKITLFYRCLLVTGFIQLLINLLLIIIIFILSKFILIVWKYFYVSPQTPDWSSEKFQVKSSKGQPRSMNDKTFRDVSNEPHTFLPYVALC